MVNIIQDWKPNRSSTFVKADIITNGVCEIVMSGPCGIVLFGASGNLVHKKLIPSLFKFYITHSIPENFFIIGVARTKMDDAAFRRIAEDAIKNEHNLTDEAIIDKFNRRCFYLSGGYDEDKTYKLLKKKISELDKEYQTLGNIIFNLAVPSEFYSIIIEKLGLNGLVKKGQIKEPFQRVMVEKPFGRRS